MSNPPPLPQHARAAAERTMLIVSSAALVAVLFLLVLSAFGHAGQLTCKWKVLTGLPCAGCGGTRALLLLGHGDWRSALLMNPGAVLLTVAFGIVSMYAASVVFLGLPPWRPSWAARVPWRWVAAASIMANWVYLLAAGRA